jgi:O-antigen/teichoic acid export membrane protein
MAPWLSRNTINAPHLSDPLRLGAIILFLSALNGAQSGALSGFEAFKTIAHINLFIGLISFPILVAGAYYGGLQGVLLAMAANLALNWIINNRALHREANRSFVPLDHFGCTQELSVLWKFSLPAALSAVLVGPTNWICAALLVNQPRGYEEMGLFNAANQWRMAILFVPGVVGQVVLPLLSSIHAESDKLQFRRVLKVNIVLGVAISLSVALPIILAANLIMSIYGPGFEMGALTLKILAFSSILTAANSVVGYAISSRGKMWVGFLFNALWAISLIVAVHIMIRGEYGATGMAYAILVSYALHTVWQIIYLAAVLKPKNSGQVLMA